MKKSFFGKKIHLSGVEEEERHCRRQGTCLTPRKKNSVVSKCQVSQERRQILTSNGGWSKKEEDSGGH